MLVCAGAKELAPCRRERTAMAGRVLSEPLAQIRARDRGVRVTASMVCVNAEESANEPE